MFLMIAAFASPPMDLAVEISRKSCEKPANALGTHPGAESFYTGGFAVGADGTVSGFERRYLFANSAWKAGGPGTPGEDCVDAWTVKGTQGKPLSCADCSFSVSLAATIDTKATTCKRRLNAEANRFEVVYDVKEAADGTVTVQFPSGKVLGKGRKTDNGYSWATDQTCIWF